MEEKIKSILADILEIAPAQITDAFGPDRCQNWDSLNNLRIITALEKEFIITFSWQEISSMTDLARIREVIGRRVAEK